MRESTTGRTSRDMHELWDCNTSVGWSDAPERWAEYTPKALEAQMDHCAVTRCYAWHRAALDYHPLYANEALFAIARAHPRIRPVPVLLPDQTGEFPPPDAVVRMLSENGARLVKFFPRTLMHALSEWQCGPLLRALEDAGAVVLVDVAETDWEALGALCAAHPRLAVVVTNVGHRQLRFAAAMLRAAPRLYLDSSGMKSFGALDALCRLGFVERILFGTDAMNLSMAAGVGILRWSGLNAAQKERVSFGNLARLLCSPEGRL